MIDFNRLIDNHLARESTHKKAIGKYYPSEIGGCIRKTWYSYKNPKPTEAKLARIFHTGDMLHEFVVDVIISEKNPEVELLEAEFPIKIEEKDFLISGRIDSIILVKLNNEKVLVEVKSCKYLPKEHKEEHEAQLQLYMHATQIHEGIILYIQKDNLESKSFSIKYDEKKIEKIIERFKILDSSLKKGEIPEAEAKHNEEKSWMCDYCPWKTECWERDD